ncbi:MAG: phosphatase [Acidobacteria bacterium]|jgi:3-deoxy-D-manno-octulosonate 8-phosphate phosphatase (KDO 8-P phosphatase)|nr:phosphatase [Acidobacteriota bacterium]
MELKDLSDLFRRVGGEFCVSEQELYEKVLRVRGIIFDWDGVFHGGWKGDGQSGLFCEVDSMGINMLRYGIWRRVGKLPFMAIISGENDKTALFFAQREHFDAIYTGVADKKQALDRVCEAAGISPLEVGCVFDDINDLSMAKHCGLRVQIRRPAGPLFMEYTKKHKLCDYITGNPAQAHAIREFCELFLGVLGNFQEVIESRTAFDENYQKYWKQRNEEKN